MNPYAELIATLAKIGYMKPASGTWGSAAAVPLFWALHESLGVPGVLIGTAVAFVAGLWATQKMTANSDNEDPSEIVIDELVGMWIALIPVSIGSAMAGMPSTTLWPAWPTAFLAFRLFDIWKPGPIGWADRRGDALGVMLDDVIAGVFAAVVVLVFAGVYHGLIQ
ncbi:phosphatidylglycerophosphatase A [Celeribacter ethanolicus]|uniref:Phosphatidylglycerophosphatase A n=1 Tax=Celeribacter ethanolicus TaxID=1758178 RepID=A0A291GA06_9RHOB|nr:phosphatidylglycerophosphatase A [Celeribacter ethanolicus]ATG46997.1 phosphatidylglycerophosphatase A [Celeribacter ethanolicus]TNE69340.1 MAG: phosphatidylglycerophosphatase A [Paracoccaceae bacterium]